MSYTDRYRHLREQRAYDRRVAAFGLPAMLAPYTGYRPSRYEEVEAAALQIPRQRRRLLRKGVSR